MRFLLLVACVVAAGCSASIRRHGYAIPDGQPLADCTMPIHNDPKLDLSGFEVLGRIEAHDSGFSTDCDKEVVLREFTREACHLDADLINVTEEDRPDFWSTCYRRNRDVILNGAAAGAVGGVVAP